MSQHVSHESTTGCSNKSLSSSCLEDNNSASSILNKALMNYNKAVTSAAANLPSGSKPLVINHHSSTNTSTSATMSSAPSQLDKIDNWNEAHYILSNLPPQSILNSIMSSSGGVGSVNPKTLAQQHHMPLLTSHHLASALASTANTITATVINNKSSTSKSTSNTKNSVSKSSNALLLQQSSLPANDRQIQQQQQQQQRVDLKSSLLTPGTKPTDHLNLNSSTVQAATTGFATARLVDLGKRLLEAARDGHTDQVRHLVVNSGAPFTSDWLGTTALHLASQNGHHEIVEILLKGGVNREARTKLERTALHAAAQGGWLKVVELLISHGAEVNPRDMLKMTPLHWAVEREHVAVAERLLLAGADVHMKSKFQLSPLDLAQVSPNFEMKQLFKNLIMETQDCLGKNDSLSLYADFSSSFYESHDMLGASVDCLLPHLEGEDSSSPHLHHHYHNHQPQHQNNNNNNTSRNSAILGVGGEHCIDLVELEWNNMKLESFLTNTNGTTLTSDEDGDEDGPKPKVEYLMKVVEELQKENQQLRQRVELLTTTSAAFTTKRR